VLKPGGHILAFSAARTYHHLAVTIEQAGFEIRDQIMWIYSSGFPKSQDVGKALAKKKIDNSWSGWGTQLKPAHEPIVLARKPLHRDNSIARNCQQWAVGALNIDAGRVPTDEVIVCGAGSSDTFNKFNAENNVDGPGTGIKINKDVPKWEQNTAGRFPSNVIGEIADYQKYFYCPKVGRKERHVGHTDDTGNNHPTVKPIELMKYLIKLVTPAGGHILDPFNGSGSTGCAAVELDYDYTGIELDPKYVDIANQRIAAWYAATHLPGVFEYDAT
jgi:site-specific DNA-methyltransferase (adenine-specific)